MQHQKINFALVQIFMTLSPIILSNFEKFQAWFSVVFSLSTRIDLKFHSCCRCSKQMSRSRFFRFRKIFNAAIKSRKSQSQSQVSQKSQAKFKKRKIEEKHESNDEQNQSDNDIDWSNDQESVFVDCI